MVGELNFETEEIHLSILEKTIIVILWLLVMVVGNLLLIGLIQFERLSGDPCKRRIVDQVSQSFIKKNQFPKQFYDQYFSSSQFNTCYFCAKRSQ